MKTKEPEELRIYREWFDAIIAEGPPRFCYNCMYYTREGKCEMFNVEPPEDFTQTKNQCDNWIMEPPF